MQDAQSLIAYVSPWTEILPFKSMQGWKPSRDTLELPEENRYKLHKFRYTLNRDLHVVFMNVFFSHVVVFVLVFGVGGLFCFYLNYVYVIQESLSLA